MVVFWEIKTLVVHCTWYCTLMVWNSWEMFNFTVIVEYILVHY